MIGWSSSIRSARVGYRIVILKRRRLLAIGTHKELKRMKDTDIRQTGMTDNQIKSTTTPTEALEYSRRLFENVLHWYQNADNKAQIILGLAGAFVTFLTGSIFVKHDDLAKIVRGFTPITWPCLGLMSLCVVGSIISALASLWSRIYKPAEVERLLRDMMPRQEDGESGSAEAMWFFQLIAGLDREMFRDQLAKMDKWYEVKILGSEIHTLSQNVTRKHKWVNRGFVLAGMAFIFFLIAGISYLINFKS